ncbi:unnamed protein product [Arabidopsis thaliana]|uniref:Jacalin-type lectin domain-containing protein n=1 Tax=Arabidopsis thaliana TaxID=3702 RepID=A0A654EHQ4_ARATH|nr:unnamed protein product [Arabidopsis thaliana]
MAHKVEAKGGKGGNQWDDSADHDNVTKILVRGGLQGIQYVKFDYVKSGQPQTGSIHGVSGRGITETIDIDPKNEHLVSVEGYYDEEKGVIQALKFKTNKKSSELIGFDDTGSKFLLQVNGKKIIGFHGYAETHLNSLGAYFTTAPPTKLDNQGGPGGQIWDDGPNYNGVKKISFSLSNNEIRQIRFDYDKNGVVERREHGQNVGQQDEFVVDYPTEYITSVEGTYDNASNPTQYVRSLIIKTSKGRTSKTFGNPSARKFVLESNGSALIGFHGRGAGCLDAIGAYFSPLIPSPPLTPEKLQADGGEGGNPWDDGAFNSVRKIYVGQGENGVNAVKFVYDKDSQVTEGKDHGKPTLLGYEEFELDYPSEYITAVEVFHDKILGSEGGVITMLKFKTNKRTSPPFGMESTTTSFVLGKEGYKIVGFHGKSSHELHKLGAHVVPITQ